MAINSTHLVEKLPPFAIVSEGGGATTAMGNY